MSCSFVVPAGNAGFSITGPPSCSSVVSRMCGILRSVAARSSPPQTKKRSMLHPCPSCFE